MEGTVRPHARSPFRLIASDGSSRIQKFLAAYRELVVYNIADYPGPVVERLSTYKRTFDAQGVPHELMLAKVSPTSTEALNDPEQTLLAVFEREVEDGSSSDASSHFISSSMTFKEADLIHITRYEVLEDMHMAEVDYISFPPGRPLPFYDLVLIASIVHRASGGYHLTDSNSKRRRLPPPGRPEDIFPLSLVSTATSHVSAGKIAEDFEVRKRELIEYCMRRAAGKVEIDEIESFLVEELESEVGRQDLAEEEQGDVEGRREDEEVLGLAQMLMWK
ncbi:hypothetical protein NP233_g4546 [Leucocoprinus birnbaumii]|uniref:Uncharacterized protein n=1 Tax=Leucocoprinus birnbaumii TaxID=56174 RepID=A0AAD5YXH9_9AGAR|nr:hypothetical protein NP233_g4546 [Leucocoprinus birnbaumii]